MRRRDGGIAQFIRREPQRGRLAGRYAFVRAIASVRERRAKRVTPELLTLVRLLKVTSSFQDSPGAPAIVLDVNRS